MTAYATLWLADIIIGYRMAEDKRFILAKLALEQGDRFQARDHLSSLLKEDQENIEYWLLMSTVVDSKKEQVLCLRKVLDLDPNNKDARLGMILFGAHQPGELRAAPIKNVDWSRNLPDLRKKVTELEKKVRKLTEELKNRRKNEKNSLY